MNLMKAVCVSGDRTLELRDVPTPDDVSDDYLLVKMEAAAINHGDKTFLKGPALAGSAPATRIHDIWGASGSGRVLSMGAGVPSCYANKPVAIYRGLQRDRPAIGMWSERTRVPYRTCLPLPDDVSVKAYSGSLVNVMTAYAFIEQAMEEGHCGLIATAGNSATGRALLALARRRRLPAILLVRTQEAKVDLERHGAEHVIVTNGELCTELGELASTLSATAVFDGVGGALITSIAPILPMKSTIYFYGFLGSMEQMSFSSVLFMFKNLTMKRFSNFDSPTVRDIERLDFALEDLRSCIDDPLFQTCAGREFRLEEIDMAINFEGHAGGKAVFII
jgi:NADPH2:quinone reductase